MLRRSHAWEESSARLGDVTWVRGSYPHPGTGCGQDQAREDKPRALPRDWTRDSSWCCPAAALGSVSAMDARWLTYSSDQKQPRDTVATAPEHRYPRAPLPISDMSELCPLWDESSSRAHGEADRGPRREHIIELRRTPRYPEFRGGNDPGQNTHVTMEKLPDLRG